MRLVVLTVLLFFAACRSWRLPPPSDSSSGRSAGAQVEADSAAAMGDSTAGADDAEPNADSLRAVAIAAAIVDSVRAAVRDSVEAARRDSARDSAARDSAEAARRDSARAAAARDSAEAARRDSARAAAARDSVEAARRDSARAAAARDSVEAARRDSARAAPPVDASDELEELEELGPSYIPYDEGPETIWDTEAQATLTKALLPVLRDEALPARTRTVLWLLIRADGAVEDAIIQTGSGSDAFDAAALRFALQLRFVPAVRGGRPVPVWVLRPISLLMR